MYRKRIILDGNSDAAALLAEIGSECCAAGLSAADAQSVVAAVRDSLRTLVESGIAVTSVGGQFHASREVQTNAAAITLIAKFGERPGRFARLWKAISGRR